MIDFINISKVLGEDLFNGIFCRCPHFVFAPIYCFALTANRLQTPSAPHISQPYLLCNPLQCGFLTYFSHISLIFHSYFSTLFVLQHASHIVMRFVSILLQYSILPQFCVCYATQFEFLISSQLLESAYSFK